MKISCKQILYCSICFTVLLIQSCVSSNIKNYQFNQKTAPNALQSDLILLKKILENKHPSLYWYTPKDTIDVYFNNAINSITDSLSEIDFRNKVATVVSKINCGHTSVLFSKNFTKAQPKYRFPHFPLAIKTWADSMVVLGNYWRNDTIFKRGTIITHINGKSVKTMIDSMFQLISTDGFSNNYKSQVISGNFYRWHQLAWGNDSIYGIQYINKYNQIAKANINAFKPIKDTNSKDVNNKETRKLLPKKEVTPPKLLTKRSLSIDTTNHTAYMRIATFSSGKLRRFFRKSFKLMAEKKVTNLIIDIRENTGGKINSSILLTKYLIQKPFKMADSAYAINRSLQFSKYIPSLYQYWLPMNFLNRKKKDGFFHFVYNEKHNYQPKQKHHFNHSIYIVQGGYTFSAASMFAANLLHQQNVTIVGEETGGGYYGNSAMYLPTIILPNSKLRVTLPLYRIVMDVNRPHNGRGIIPDVIVNPSSNAISRGIDIKIDTILQQIKYKQQVAIP